MLSESPVVTVHIPPELRHYVADHDEIMASGDTVGEILEAVSHEYPGIRGFLVGHDGGLPSGLAVYLGATSVRELQGLATPVGQEELVTLVPTGLIDSAPDEGQ